MMDRVKFLLVDGVLFHTLGILCKDEKISFQEAVRLLFTKGARSERLRKWAGNLYDYSISYYEDKGIDKPVRLIPVYKNCWTVINEFCNRREAEPAKIMQAMITKSSFGEITRTIIKRSYALEEDAV